MRQMGRLDNFGIRRVERLDGNVGYLDVRRVAVPANAGPAIAAAMELVAGTYALIIDLRHNHGGSPWSSVSYVAAVRARGRGLLVQLPAREGGRPSTTSSTPTRRDQAVLGAALRAGHPLPDRPVYVLTSGHTFSGGEDFAYTLQALGRAEVIGETTGGGAHPTRPFPISAAVHIGIPFARSVNPVTGTNWQGTGVAGVAVPERGLRRRYAKALGHVPRAVSHTASTPAGVTSSQAEAGTSAWPRCPAARRSPAEAR